MKKYLVFILGCLIFNLSAIHGLSDRNWQWTTVTLNAEAKRVTNPYSGVLYVTNNGTGTIYVDFNATANVSSPIKISDGGMFTSDGYNVRAPIRAREYFTIYSDSSATCNWVILD